MTGTILLTLGLFLVGMLLIALEAFVLPGLGLPGLGGAALVLFTSFYAWTQIGPVWGMVLGGTALLVSFGLVVWVPRSRMGERLTLKDAISDVAPYDEDAKRAGAGLGARGVTATQLRPSGYAWFGENRVEVRSEGDYIERDVLVEVVRIKDAKLFVEPIEEDDDTAELNEPDA